MQHAASTTQFETRPQRGFFKALQAHFERRRRNHCLRQVMELNDHQLRDIGLTRGDIAAMMR